MRSSRVILLLILLHSMPASAAIFQYAVPVQTNRSPSTAYLWLPPDAPQIRGVFMAGMTLAERELAKDPVIRRACADEQLAIVFLKTGLQSADPQKILDDLAKASGYPELSIAPLFFFGHSAGGPQAKARARELAARCFGLVQYRGGVPGGADPIPPGLPCLMMIGQFDEFGGTMRNEAGRETWQGGCDALAAFRAASERHLASLVVEPGAGHFAWSDRNAQYLALFLRKAAHSQIPQRWPVDSPRAPALLPLNPRSGWLTDLNIQSPNPLKPAPFDAYPGDKTRAAWHFDRELADAAFAYHASQFGRKDQFIRWADPTWVDAGVRHFFTRLTWVGDGQTFQVHPVYAETYPAGKSPAPRWADAGKPAGHASSPIRIRHVSGPVVPAGPDTLRMRFDTLEPATEPGRVTFMAVSDGDAQYRHTEQVGMMPRGFTGLAAGKPQVITFPELPNLKPDSPPIPLNAASDSGLPVEYYIACGPAVIDQGKLRIAELPSRARYPVEVKVVAWQFGRGVDPLVKTAIPVERTLRIERP